MNPAVVAVALPVICKVHAAHERFAHSGGEFGTLPGPVTVHIRHPLSLQRMRFKVTQRVITIWIVTASLLMGPATGLSDADQPQYWVRRQAQVAMLRTDRLPALREHLSQSVTATRALIDGQCQQPFQTEISLDELTSG
jgi:hypothetical protein